VAGSVLGLRAAGGPPGLPAGIGRTLLENIQRYGVVAGTTGTFRVSSTHWLEKTEQVLASLLGPFPLPMKAAAAALVAVVVVLVLRSRSRTEAQGGGPGPLPIPIRGLRPACAAFALAAVLAPAAMQVPDDLSLLDFRLITTATILAVAVVPPRAFATSAAARFGLAGAAALFLALWARQLEGAAGEVLHTVRLVDRLGPQDRLLALPMHDASAHLDERNAILHYAAVYHTARHGGVTSLFWGKFSPRLPVGYRPGLEPSHPPDWAPWELTDEQLQGFTHVVVRWPNEDDDARQHALAEHICLLVAHGTLTTVACDGDSCLLEVGSLTASAGRPRP
jgi:hypothetical protein